MRNSYDVIKTDNHVILKTLQNFHFVEYFIFVCQFGLKHVEPNIRKIFMNNTFFFITKYLNLIWNIVKKFYFYQKMIDFKYEFSKFLLVSDGCLVNNFNPYCIILQYSAPLDNLLGLYLVIHMQSVPPIFDLFCGLVLIFLCWLLSVSDDTVYFNCFRQVSSSKFALKYFLL